MILAALIGGLAVHERHLLRTILLYPLRDLLGFLCWVGSYASSTVVWRGIRYRLSRGGLMHSIDTAPPAKSESALTT
jgi:ceramide glucosyltransferase